MEIVLRKRLPMARYGFVSHGQYGILVSYAASCARADRERNLDARIDESQGAWRKEPWHGSDSKASAS